MSIHSVVHDSDPNIKFERHSQRRSRANVILVPLLNLMPLWLRPLIRRTHRAADIFVKHAMTYKALEVAYTRGRHYPSRNSIERFFYQVWFGTANVLAVRNRLRVVKRELKRALRDNFSKHETVRLLSIAAGSARAVIEAVHEAGYAKNKNLFLVFLDKDETALEYSKLLVKEFAIECPIEWTSTTLGTYLRTSKGMNFFNVIEMVGLLDYFTDVRAVELFDHIYDVLKPSGVFVTGNIIAHAEKPLLSRFAGWHVIYREPEQLLKLLVRSKFTKHDITVYVEPHKIHAVSVAVKHHA